VDWAIATVAALSLLVTLGLWRIASARPTLDYEVTYLSHALGERGGLGGVLQAKWGTSNPPDPHVLALRIGNHGRRPIRADQFATPLTVTFEDAWLLEVIHTASSTDALEPTVIRQEDNRSDTWVEVEPLLLNGGDWFEIQAFTNGHPQPFSVGGRIEGITHLRDRLQVRKRRQRIMSLIVPAVWAVLSLLVWAVIRIGGADVSFEPLATWLVGSTAGLVIGRREALRS